MSNPLLRTIAWCVVASFSLLAPPSSARTGPVEDPVPAPGVAFSVLDPKGEIRDVVGAEIERRFVERLREETAPSEVWTQTMFSALGVVAAELEGLEREGRLDGPSRREIGALAVIAVVDVLVDRHPGLMPALSGFGGDLDALDSPIERLCACDKSGSKACGCSVWSTGPGSCNYRVLCNHWTRAACSAINLEMCIAQTVFEIAQPTRKEDWRSESSGIRPGRGTARPE